MTLYQNTIPTKVYFGRNIWQKALEAQEALLQGNVMIVTTGRSLYRLGYVDKLKLALQQNKHITNVMIFDNVSANPKLSEVQSGILFGRQEKADIVIGFGGGSAIDAAKAIAIGIKSKDEIGILFHQGKEPETTALPIIAIPTTAGTGSELSKAAILTDEIHKVKGGIRGNALYPVTAIVDSCFTESLPLQITMETGFDVLAHAIESYISKAASPYTKMQSETAIRIAGQCLPQLAECLENINAREQMSFASMIMGINLGNASTCLPHRLQYPLGAHTDTSHGAGLAALFTSWLRCEYRFVPNSVEKILTLLTGNNVHGELACTKTIYRFIQSLGLASSLQEMGITKDQLPIMASEVSGNIQNDPASQEDGVIQKIYEMAWQGETVCKQS